MLLSVDAEIGKFSGPEVTEDGEQAAVVLDSRSVGKMYGGHRRAPIGSGGEIDAIVRV
jgi:hypothetical protein